MTITSGGLGTGSNGTTSCTPAYPASIVAGDLLLLYVGSKYPPNAPSTPSGFTLLARASGGAGAAGSDSGETYASVYYRIADGSETGTITVTVTGGNSVRAQMQRWKLDSPLGPSFDTAVAADTTSGTDWALSFADVEMVPGDQVLVISCANTDAASVSSGGAFSATGITFGTPNTGIDSGITAGDDLRLFVTRAIVSSGSGSLTVSYTATLAAAAAGCGALVRIHELNNYTLACDQGSFTLTGNDVTPSWGAGIAADRGQFALTGNDAGLSAGLSLAADRGQFTLTGNDATLTNGYGIVAEVGAFTLTGRDAALTSALSFAADQGSFALTGNAAGLSAGYVVAADVGAFTLTGFDAGFAAALSIAADAGAYSLTGQDVGLVLALTLDAEAGTYTLTGYDVSLTFSGWSQVPADGTWANQIDTATWVTQSGSGSWTVQTNTGVWVIQTDTDGWTVQ